MRCEEAAEFLSALWDGERIPREAAEHVGLCETCRARLKEYAEMGAELRRVASLESVEEAREGAWKKEHSVASNWWWKGWDTMRIPRFAFALMLVVIVALSSGLAILKARPNVSRVLILTIKPPEDEAVRCLLSGDQKAAPCTFIEGVKLGMLSGSFRIIRDDGDRIELGVRSKFTPRPATEPGNAYSMSASLEEIENLVERSYWFRPGQALEVQIDGFGTAVVTGRMLNYIPSIVTSGGEQLAPMPDELRVISPALLRSGELVFELEGFTSASDKSKGVYIYAPTAGRYLLSLSPLEGAVQGHIRQSRVQFEISGESYMFLMAAPLARAEHIWILREPKYKPSQETTGARDDQPSVGTVDLSLFLAKTSAKN